MATPFAELKSLEPLMDACVHCGFCLPACPSYVLLGQETDSPRGRIYMMRAGVEERMPLTPSVVAHFDTCLGCMACETACPSGVKYAPLVEQTRATIEHHHERPAGERWFRTLLFKTLPYPARLRLLALPLAVFGFVRRWRGLVARLPPRLRSLLTLAPEVSLSTVFREAPALTPARGERQMTVGLVTGCVQRAFFGDVNAATVRVLAAEGCEVHAPAGQGCCGALALHAGEDETARAFARALIASFERQPVDTIAVNAAGCGSAMKEYGHLLRSDPAWSERARAFSARVRDVSEVLAGLPVRAPRRPQQVRVAYHDACHLAHAQGVRKEPRQLLQSIPGVTLVPFAEADLCCGSAGIFNLVQPEMAATLGDRKIANITAVSPDVIVTSNPGCLLQMQAAAARKGQDVKIEHIMTFLNRAIS